MKAGYTYTTLYRYIANWIELKLEKSSASYSYLTSAKDELGVANQGPGSHLASKVNKDD